MKRLFTLLAVALLVATLAGCTPSDPESSLPSPTPVTDTTTTTTVATEAVTTTTTEADTGSKTAQTTGSDNRTTATAEADTGSKTTQTTGSDNRTTAATTAKTSTVPVATTTTKATTVPPTTTAAPSPLRSDKKLGEVDRLRVGDTMVDFRTTDSEGNTVLLSDVLREKKVVILNFWFVNCVWCVKEFPAMDKAYREQKDAVEILALTPYDTTSAVKTFRSQHGLSFPMAACPTTWATPFRIQGYPTTVVIDRNGIICMVQSGAMTDETIWQKLMSHFTADNYQTTLLKNGINDLLNR